MKTDIYRWFDFQQHETHAASTVLERNSAPKEETRPFLCNRILTGISSGVEETRAVCSKTGTRCYFVKRSSLKLPRHWTMHTCIGLCIYSLQYCTKKFSDRAYQLCKARTEVQSNHPRTAGALVISTNIARSQVSSFRRLRTDSWLLSFIARQHPLEVAEVFSLYH